jgi:iron complex outermembrane receptor protein
MKGKNTILSLGLLFLLVCPAFTEDTGESLEELLSTKISTATKREHTMSEAPASVTIITADEIQRFGYRTLDQILSRVRGFYPTYDRHYRYMGMRGFGRPSDYNNRVLLLLNGNPTADNVAGASYIGTEFGLDVSAIERIEVVRGPGSALYGSNAMLAVINVITRCGKTEEGLKLSLQPGSFGKIQGSARYGARLENDLDIFLSGQIGEIEGRDLYFQEFDSPGTNNGWVRGLDWDKYYGFYTGMKYKNFSLQAQLSSREKGIPTAPYMTIFNDERIRTLDTRQSIQLKYVGIISYDKAILLRGYFNRFTFEGTYPFRYPFFEGVAGTRAKGSWMGVESQFNWDIRHNNRLILGVEYKRHFHASYKTFDNYQTYFDQDFPFEEITAYIQDEYQLLKNLSVVAGARYDKYSGRIESVTPRAAVIYNPFNSTTLKFLYGNAYRAPSILETYYEIPGEVKRNPGIQREQINTIEAVIEQRIGKYFLGVLSLYNFEMKGLIEQIFDPSDGLLQYQNFEKIKGKGIEAELNCRLENGVTGYASCNIQKARDVATGQEITNSPAVLFKSGLSIPLFKNFHASIETSYSSSRLTVYGTRTDPYLLTGIHFSSKPLFRHLRFSLRVDNLFDIEYRHPGGYEHAQPAIVQDGREFSLKIEYLL